MTRETKYGETGKIVTIITHDSGKISAIANNVRSKKSGMLAGLQLFAYSEFVLFKSKSKKGLYHLNEVTLLESFDSIRTSLDKLAYASYFADVVNHALPEESPDENVLRLLLNTLFVLHNDLYPLPLTKLVFEWRMAAETGYAPFLEACNGCGKASELTHLNVADGQIMCADCAAASSAAIPLTPGMISIISYIASADSKKIFAFDTNEETLAYLSRVGEIYLSTQLEAQFPTLDYLKKVTTLSYTEEK